ncbi:TVA19 protein, partial [Polypterus senegalus]
MHPRILVLTLLTSLGHGVEDRVWQPGNIVQVLQKQEAEIKCNYEARDTANLYLFWYIQTPNGAPRHLMTRTPTYGINEEGFKERFNATLSRENKTVHLKISSSKLSDSAIYFCALQPTVRERKWRTLHKLM